MTTQTIDEAKVEELVDRAVGELADEDSHGAFDGCERSLGLEARP